MTAATIPDPLPVAQRLFAECGFGDVTRLEPIAGGRNNRVFRAKNERVSAILKQSYRSPYEGHDRWAAEVAWYELCREANIHWTPELWASDRESSCVLLEELSGRRVCAGDVTPAAVEQAADFVRDVNRHRDTVAARNVPMAAEAYFSLADHQAGIARRIERLRTSVPADDLDAALHDWLRAELLPLWNTARSRLRQSEQRAELPQDERCLSPSDFGFHNAWRLPSGELRFLDFEYAGWDDPAKLLCDFYWQVELPAPRDTWSVMFSALPGDRERLLDRVRRLFPAFGIKWCCIVLNEFLRPDRERRQFAGASDQRQTQWDKARTLLQDVQTLLDTGWPTT